MKSNFKKCTVALAVASCLTLTPWIAEAAGLGRITVLSGLGQPLRAELEVNASSAETTAMTARLAPQEAFHQAGIDYASALQDLRFSVEKRRGGQVVIKVSSSKPVNEPFLDFLVELNWPAGRLVREYTFLLDPPEIAAKSATRMVNTADAKVVQTIPGGGNDAASRREPPPVSAPRPLAQNQTKSLSGGDTHLVQSGETLRKIALETMPEGVSLEQMLVGLYNSNPEAFIGKNINRLKAGVILDIPDRATVSAVPQSEARKIYVAQANDWNAYRQRLASVAAQGPAKQDSGGQSSSGKIAPKVEEKTTPLDLSKDQVKVSRTELASQTKTSAAVAENNIAKEKGLKDAQDRLAQLEKNVSDLQKLLEAKNQKLAELQNQADPKKEGLKPAAVPVVASTAAIEVEKPVEATKPPVEAPLPEPTKVVEPPPKPIEAVKPPEPPKKIELPQSEPDPEPGFVDELLDDPLPLAGAAAILALLGGYFFAKRRRQNAPAETTAAPGPSSLGPNSVFRMTGGQSVDTGNTPPQTGDFSQTGPGTIDTDEVDPVAEADVYMAYGRDAQAEEILIEALQKDPQRTAIHAKLLEIYANRKSLKQFETLASELYGQTGGHGSEWAKVAALGAGLDPQNPLYSSAHGTSPAAFDADATMIVSPDTVKSTLAVSAGLLAQAAVAEPSVDDTFVGQAPEPDLADDALLMQFSGEPDIPLDVPEEPTVAVDDVMSLDFDLGSTNVEPDRPQVLDPQSEPEFVRTIATADSNALDFDLGMASEPSPEEMANEPLPQSLDQLDSEIIDFDIGAATSVGAESLEPDSTASPDFSPAGTLVMPGLDSLTSTFVGNETSVSSEDMLDFQTPSEPDMLAEPEMAPLVDFDLATEADPSSATVVNPDALRMVMDEPFETSVQQPPSEPMVDEDESLEFDVSLTDSAVLGGPMATPSYDIGSINLDLSADEPVESTATEPPAFEINEPDPISEALPDMVPLASEFSDALREEVSTKLDLAKAYEEMGDLEGARELLLEVQHEGPLDLVEQAREILGRIGE